MSVFKKAERKQVKLKLAITGPSGSGKTYSALKIAKGLAAGGKIAVVDTENGSASLYSDLPGMPAFDTVELGPPFTSERYMQLIRFAEKEGYSVLIVDSITHQWNGEGGIMDRLDKEKIAKPGTNSFTLWSKFTPEHERFKQCILQTPIHIIATMRSKQDYVMDLNEKGKQTPRKVGLAPIQREGAEYEFTTVFDMTHEHYATVSKDRTSIFDGETFNPTEETGEKILKWVSSGAEYKPEWKWKEEYKGHLIQLGSVVGWDINRILTECALLFSNRKPSQLTEQEYLKLCQTISPQRESFEASPEFEKALAESGDPRSMK